MMKCCRLKCTRSLNCHLHMLTTRRGQNWDWNIKHVLPNETLDYPVSSMALGFSRREGYIPENKRSKHWI